MICFYAEDRQYFGKMSVGLCHCISATKRGQGYVIYSMAYQITLPSSFGGMFMVKECTLFDSI